MPEELAPHEEALGEAMAPVVEYAAFELNRESGEGIVLEPLGRFPRAAEAIAMSLAEEDDPYIRGIGALIPGYAPGCDPDVLEEIWRMEIKRRDSPDRDDDDQGLEAALTIAETDSVAERIVISAVRWLRMDEARRRCAGMILRDMVARTIEGQNWNDAHWALSALFCAGDPEAHELARQFAELKSGPEYFPLWAERLLAGDPGAISAADDLVSGSDAAQRSMSLPRPRQKELDILLAAAAKYEAAVH